MDVSKAVWTQKEIEEQALVSRYIINCFKTIRLREFEEDGPRTVQAGNLIHLKTKFSVDMNEVGFPTLGTTMIKLLHPTSAVCGMPKDKAFDFLKANENIDRKFYSGFLGPVNIEKATNIFVNIRCAEFGKNKVSFYSGAGITQDSDPEKEFLETELKMKIMEKVVTSRP
jgi:isochorismate synthase